MWKLGQMCGRRASGSVVVVGLILGAGCATDVDDGAGEAIAEVALASGLTVSFYEPKPGAIEVVQHRPQGVAAVGVDQRAVELFAALAPERPVPAALVAAQARLDEARVGQASSPRPRGQSGSTTQAFIDNKTVDDHAFHDAFCAGAPDMMLCALNRRSALNIEWDDVDQEQVDACADVGNFTLRTTMPVFHSWDILEGDCVSYWYPTSWLNVTIGVQTVNVGGNDRYHLAVRTYQ